MKLKALPILALFAGGAALAEPAVDVTGTAAVSAHSGATTAAVPPELFARIPGLSPAEPVAGLDSWQATGSNMMFMRDPQSGQLIAGFAFDAEGRSLHPQLRSVEGSGLGRLIDEFFGQTLEIPKEFAASVEDSLVKLDEVERKAAIDRLVASLRGVEGEEAFNAAIADWLNTIDPVDDGSASDEVTSPEAAEPSGAGVDVEPDASPDGEEISLIDAARSGFWMQVGDVDAPAVYVITDPSCEPCRASVDILRSKVHAGDLQMRVLMVDMVDDDSLGTIAGIITSDDPAGTFLAMSMEGEAAMPFARSSGLPELVRKGLELNYHMAQTAQIPKLPFYIFDTTDGPRYIAGMPSVEQIAGALPPKKEPEKIDPAHNAETRTEDTPAAPVKE